MRRLAPALVLTAATIGGCAAFGGGMTPEQQYVEASDTYTDIVTTLAALRDAGQISDETWAIVLPLIEEGDQLLDQWQAQLAAGNVDGAALLRSGLRGIVTRLTVYLAVREGQ